jgi:hypothetical protein
MRIYSCRLGSIHLTNHEKSQKVRTLERPARARRRVETRKARYKSKRLLAAYVPEDPVAEQGPSA